MSPNKNYFCFCELPLPGYDRKIQGALRLFFNKEEIFTQTIGDFRNKARAREIFLQKQAAQGQDLCEITPVRGI